MFLLNYIQTYNPLVTAILGLGLVWLITQLLSTVKRVWSLPPGPWGLPVFGYLPFLKEHLYLQFDQLAKKYGPVFSMRLGGTDVVCVCDWTHLKQAFADEALLARPKEVFFPGIIDVASFAEMSGDPWREHRRLSVHILRDVGLGKSTMETLIKEEIDQFLPILKSTDGEPVDFGKKLGPSTANIISILIFGHKFKYSDPVKVELDKSNEQIGREFQFAGVLAFLPWLAKVYAVLGRFKLDIVVKSIKYIDNYIQTEIDMHRKKSSNSMNGDYIDGFLEEKMNREKKNIVDNNFSDPVLRRNATAFFGAGSETIWSTMLWTMTYLVKYPEYQDKIRSEIADVIGFERKPEYIDRMRMPFTMAFLYEVQRAGSIVANNLLRRASRDTYVGKYFIPKDTLVIFNFWSVHRDPELWSNPDKFDPSRFLIENDTKAVKPAYLVPFSGGKRICPGESLANVEMFLYTVSIVQKYRIKVKPGTDVSLDASYGISRRPMNPPQFIFEEYLPTAES